MDIHEQTVTEVLTIQLSITISAFQFSLWFGCWADVLSFLTSCGFDPEQDITMAQDITSDHYIFTQQKEIL